MNEYERKAHDLFLSGYNCAQAVAAAFSEKMGTDEKTVLKMASGFGGGMGGHGGRPGGARDDLRQMGGFAYSL